MMGSGAVHLRHSSLQAASASLCTAGSHLQHAAYVTADVYYRHMPSADSHLHSCHMSDYLTGPSSQLAPSHHHLRRRKAEKMKLTLLHTTTSKAAAHTLHDAWHRWGCQLSRLAAFLVLSSGSACQHPPAGGLPAWRRSDQC